ncbi:hypothetical protein EB796_012972 [Bugula neritina]|uniref:PA domain-containing protein n=1 Tax=Bugula neritina TaxID=10212 RepID=A0A7J7JSU8_BUGNE|nr:hypothetical protein EB796_012972 [Bugula neritina]
MCDIDVSHVQAEPDDPDSLAPPADSSSKLLFNKPLDTEDSNAIYFEILEPVTLRYTFKSRPARNFGTSFNQSYQSVELVIGDPLNGCSAVSNAQQIRGNSVLFQRGDCSFLTKAVVAQEAGALFLIITDNDPGSMSTKIDMVHDETGRTVNIPALFIAGKDGFMIQKELKKLEYGSFALLNIPINLTSIPYDQRKVPPWNIV